MRPQRRQRWRRSAAGLRDRGEPRNAMLPSRCRRPSRLAAGERRSREGEHAYGRKNAHLWCLPGKLGARQRPTISSQQLHYFGSGFLSLLARGRLPLSLGQGVTEHDAIRLRYRSLYVADRPRVMCKDDCVTDNGLSGHVDGDGFNPIQPAVDIVIIQPSLTATPAGNGQQSPLGAMTVTRCAPALLRRSQPSAAISPPPNTTGDRPGNTPERMRWKATGAGKTPAQRPPAIPSSALVAGRPPVATTRTSTAWAAAPSTPSVASSPSR